jgi:hypothetical protein
VRGRAWRTWVVGLATLFACRFGGPSADPEAYVTFPDEGGTDASTSTDEMAAPSGPEEGGAEPPLSGDDGGSASVDSAADDGGDDGGNCSATVPVCDPVHNTGCNPFQQCDVDPTQKTTPTGLCLFYSGSDASGACMSTAVSETCAAKQTCVGGACRAVCFCNADCAPGECCSDTSAAAPFKLCQRCQ